MLKLNDDANAINKSVWLALGLNICLMGAGFFYMGRRVIGIVLMVIFALLYMNLGGLTIAITFISLIPAWIDMGMYKKRMIKASFRDCPKCGTQVKKTAPFCVGCHTEIGVVS